MVERTHDVKPSQSFPGVTTCFSCIWAFGVAQAHNTRVCVRGNAASKGARQRSTHSTRSGAAHTRSERRLLGSAGEHFCDEKKVTVEHDVARSDAEVSPSRGAQLMTDARARAGRQRARTVSSVKKHEGSRRMRRGADHGWPNHTGVVGLSVSRPNAGVVRVVERLRWSEQRHVAQKPFRVPIARRGWGTASIGMCCAVETLRHWRRQRRTERVKRRLRVGNRRRRPLLPGSRQANRRFARRASFALGDAAAGQAAGSVSASAGGWIASSLRPAEGADECFSLGAPGDSNLVASGLEPC
mmetsp:Transcript_18479/g.57328  ORF Transcript_18479/g.57328 Transcript_18479/m.57328 type:complete len:299 (-) Transcript_18479:2316-3212(-)